jgi:hypothetical protein
MNANQMNLPISHESFIAFLLNAKRHTYAAQGDDATVTPLLLNSRQLEYQSGELFYRDIYFGLSRFVGQEVVYQGETPMWSMSYCGGLIPSTTISVEAKQIYAFLRASLSLVEAGNPYRGPKAFQEGLFGYTNENQGDIESFRGVETITYDGQQVYQLHYSGGVLN